MWNDFYFQEYPAGAGGASQKNTAGGEQEQTKFYDLRRIFT